MNNHQEESSVYIVPQNYEERAITAGGRSIRNVIEGIVMAVVTVPIFIFLPISLMYRCILIAIFGGVLFGFGMIGIKRCSVFEYILKIVQFSQSTKVIERKDDEIFDSFLQTKQQFEQEREKEQFEQPEQSEQESTTPQENTTSTQESNSFQKTVPDTQISQKTPAEGVPDEKTQLDTKARKKRKKGSKRHN